MKQGVLILDEQADRYDIRFDLVDYYGGLYCGEALNVLVDGRWRPTRIEMTGNWYLVGIRTDGLSGLRVWIQAVPPACFDFQGGIAVAGRNRTENHRVSG